MTTLTRLFLALLVSVPVLLGSAAPAAAATGQHAGKTSKPLLKKVSASAASSRELRRRAATSPRITIRSAARAPVTRTRSSVATSRLTAPRLSMGELAGLRSTADDLDLKSSVALVMDQDTNEILFSKNSQAVLPIASITKLMTAVVVTDAALPLDEVLTITQDDVDTEKGSSSRLSVGSSLTREEMLHLALMSSENRAAHALGRNYPGGLTAFVTAMNQKAQQLGMTDTHYVEPTGLSSQNQSSAHDLATLVKLAHTHPLIRELSTSPEFMVDIGHRQLQFRNTNGLVRNPSWEIGVQKTGYIVEAGRCLVMQASLAGRKLIMVFLDSTGRNTRLADAERVRRWITAVVPKAVS